MGGWHGFRVAGVLTAAAWMVAAGCGSPAERSDAALRRKQAARLAASLRSDADGVSDPDRRDRLTAGLDQVHDLLTSDSPPPQGEAPPPPATPVEPGIFDPTGIVVGFFTQSRDFDGRGGPDGLEVYIRPVDRFGDPTKAVGTFRIEVFAYRVHTTERRGDRLGHWEVPVLDVAANRRYYDPRTRSYRFPLRWEEPIAGGTKVTVQATFYPAETPDRKLIAQRVIELEG
jgi:hypothetical protein